MKKILFVIILLIVSAGFVIFKLANNPVGVVPTISVTPTTSAAMAQRITRGLKFFDTDAKASIELTFDLPEEAVVTESLLEGLPALKVSAGNQSIVFAISEGGPPTKYENVYKLFSDHIESLYRITLSTGSIHYTTELKNTNCANGPESAEPPCGSGNLEGVISECTSTEAIPFCDQIMKTFEKPNHLL